MFIMTSANLVEAGTDIAIQAAFSLRNVQTCSEIFTHSPKKTSPLSATEIRVIQAEIQRDPTIATLGENLQLALHSGSELSRQFNTANSPESQFLLSYLRWVGFRMRKGKIPSDADNKVADSLDEPGLTRTNLAEIFDRIILEYIRLNEKIPPTIIRLLFEAIQGGIERTQTAANMSLLTGKLPAIREMLDFLLTQPTLSAHQLHEGVIGLAELDGGAPYSIQRTRSELNDADRTFIQSVNPNSPLLLPSRHYSERTREAIIEAYSSKEIWQITAEECDAVVARNEASQLSRETKKAISELYEKAYGQLSFEQVEDALKKLGKTTLIERAQNIRLGNQRNLNHPQLALFTGQDHGHELVTVNGISHALVVAPSLSLNEIENVTSQLGEFSAAVARIESALQSIPQNSAALPVALESYQMLLNLGLYSPNILGQSGHTIEVLATAAIESGHIDLMEKFSVYIEWRNQKLRDNFYYAHHIYGREFRAAVESTRHYIKSQKSWDPKELEIIFGILWTLSDAKDGNDFPKDKADAILSIIKSLEHRRYPDPKHVEISKGGVNINPVVLETFLKSPNSRALIELAPFRVAFRKQEFHMIPQIPNGKTLTITNTTTSQEGSGKLSTLIKLIESQAELNGIDVILIEGVNERRLKDFYLRLGYTAISETEELTSYFKDLR